MFSPASVQRTKTSIGSAININLKGRHFKNNKFQGINQINYNIQKLTPELSKKLKRFFITIKNGE